MAKKPASKPKDFGRIVQGYAGFDQNGNPAWGTFRPSREACAEIVSRYAPEVTDCPPALRILPVWIGTDLNTQLGFSDV